MSDMDEMEIDYTRFHRGICSLRELKIMLERYKDKPIAEEIQKQIKEKEDGELDR